jgi:predicted DNA-binding transcriptional regulator AlpA
VMRRRDAIPADPSAAASDTSAPQAREEREPVAGHDAAAPIRGVIPTPSVPRARPDPARRRGLPPPRDGAKRDDDLPIGASRPDLSPTSTTATAAPSGGADHLLFRPRELAAALGVSVRTLWRLDATARLPRAVRLGTVCRWRRGEVEAWVAAGCPARDQWDGRCRPPPERD